MWCRIGSIGSMSICLRFDPFICFFVRGVQSKPNGLAMLCTNEIYSRDKGLIGNPTPWKVLLALCSLIFATPSLKWTEPTDHVEFFAGVCSITRGEWNDRIAKCFPNVVQTKSPFRHGPVLGWHCICIPIKWHLSKVERGLQGPKVYIPRSRA